LRARCAHYLLATRAAHLRATALLPLRLLALPLPSVLFRTPFHSPVRSHCPASTTVHSCHAVTRCGFCTLHLAYPGSVGLLPHYCGLLPPPPAPSASSCLPAAASVLHFSPPACCRATFSRRAQRLRRCAALPHPGCAFRAILSTAQPLARTPCAWRRFAYTALPQHAARIHAPTSTSPVPPYFWRLAAFSF